MSGAHELISENWHHEGGVPKRYSSQKKHSCCCGMGKLGMVMKLDEGMRPQPELHPESGEHCSGAAGGGGDGQPPEHWCSTQHRSPPNVRSWRYSHQPGALLVSP